MRIEDALNHCSGLERVATIIGVCDTEEVMRKTFKVRCALASAKLKFVRNPVQRFDLSRKL